MFQIKIDNISSNYNKIVVKDISTSYVLPTYGNVTRASGHLQFYCLFFNQSTQTVNGGVTQLTNTPFNLAEWTAFVVTDPEAIYQVYLYCQYNDQDALPLNSVTAQQVYDTILSTPDPQDPKFIFTSVGLAIIPDTAICRIEKIASYSQKLLNNGCACSNVEEFENTFQGFAYQLGLEEYTEALATLTRLQNLCNCSDDCNC